MSMQQVMMTANAILSDSLGSKSEIDSLTRRVDGLANAVDFWNRWMLWGLVAAAVAAAWIVLATRLTVNRSKQLSIAQGLLDTAKDRQLQEDLREKDIEIGHLRLRADTAEKDIGSEKADTAKATQKAAEANKIAEEERIERLKLEAQIAPRRLTPNQQMKIAENCAGFNNLFSGKRVRVVSYALDMEGFVFSEQIASSLRTTGMAVDDDALTITPIDTIVMGIQVFGSDSGLAKKIAYAIGSTDSPIAVSFTETDPTARAIKIDHGAPQPDVTILVGLKPPDKNTIDELARLQPQKSN